MDYDPYGLFDDNCTDADCQWAISNRITGSTRFGSQEQLRQLRDFRDAVAQRTWQKGEYGFWLLNRILANIYGNVLDTGGFPGLVAGSVRTTGVRTVRVPSSRYPETARHISDAQAAGYPSTLTIARPGAPGRRAEALAGHERPAGKQLDEYPPAMFKEGGAGASVRPVSPADNMGAGACIGNQCRGLPDGTCVRIKVD
jgi:filamentous hemagglutinin